MPNLYPKNLEYLLDQNLIEEIPANAHEVNALMSLSEATSISTESLLYKDLAKLREIGNKDIKMLIMDCDGVLTDGAMIFTKEGDEIKHFNAKDGQGIKNCQKAGMFTGIISAGISTGLVERRAEMLGVKHVYVGKQAKIEILEQWLTELNLSFENIAYIGDDITDIPILEKVGASFCPANAVKAVKQVAGITLYQNGGDGCIRELVDEYLLPI